MDAARGLDVDVNAPRSVASAILLGTIGVIAFIVQPGLVDGFVTTLGLTDAQANDLAGIEMLGVALATILVSALGERISWRVLTAAALLLGAAGDFASAGLTHSQYFAASRFAAGFGHGAIISLSFTFVGLTAHPARNIALYLVALLSYGAVGLWRLPALLAAYGFAPVLLFFGAVTLASLVTVPHLPRSSAARTEPGPSALHRPLPHRAIALCGVLFYNIAQGIAWANLALIGAAAGLAQQQIANDLFLSQLLAVVGALLSVVLATSARRMTMIAIGIGGGGLSIAALIGAPSALLFLAAVCGFNLLWNFVLPFILSAVGDFDLHGRMISWAVMMQMIGLGLGPILSARLIGQDGFLQVELACIFCFAASLVLLAGPLAAHAQALRNTRQTP